MIVVIIVVGAQGRFLGGMLRLPRRAAPRGSSRGIW